MHDKVKCSSTFKFYLPVLPDLDESDDVLAEDEGVGHDGAEYEHDAGKNPDRQSCGSLTRNFQLFDERKWQQVFKRKTTATRGSQTLRRYLTLERYCNSV